MSSKFPEITNLMLPFYIYLNLYYEYALNSSLYKTETWSSLISKTFL